MYPLCLLLEWALIAFAMLGLFFLFQRRCGGAVVLAVALYVLGLAEYFVILFKSMPISPGDLTALSTAAAVAGTGFTYTITSFCMLSLAFTVIAIQISLNISSPLSRFALSRHRLRPNAKKVPGAAWCSTY